MKRFISGLVALSAAALLVGCSSGGGSGGGQAVDALVGFEPVKQASFDQQIVPYPFDGLFAGFSSPTLNIPLPDPGTPSDPVNAPVIAANMTDGFSTAASLFADVLGPVDYATVPGNVVLIDTRTGNVLQYGTDFTVQNELATAPNPITGADQPIAAQRSRLLILLKKPLQPATTYLAAVTTGIKTTSGGHVIPSAEFQVTASATPVSQQNAPILQNLDSNQKATLEALRAQVIYPAVQALGQAGIPSSTLALAWTFTTESIGDTLKLIQQNPSVSSIGLQVANTNHTADYFLQAGAGAPTPTNSGDAEIYAGVTRVPYYLGVPTQSDPTAPLTGYWHADANQPANAVFAPTANAPQSQQIPCAAFAQGAALPDGQTLKPSASTTACFPHLDASTMTTQTIPVLMAVPDANSGQTEPGNGWPVVIFQHGITRNRTDMLTVADGLAKAGFVVVAIDLPLHGITDPANSFYDNQLFDGTGAAGLKTTERTFDLDLENNATSAPGPDGQIDPSGSHFINLQSLVTTRDNNRQAVSDLINLAATLKANGNITVVDAATSNVSTLSIDPTKIVYFGHSLGAIVGSTLMGLDPGITQGGAIGAAVLANPGGAEAKLLDASGAFGPVISAGLAAAGVRQGSDDYETFLRFAQQLTDPADPINYATAAAAQHSIDMIEVIGDAVVPNSTPSTCPASLSLASITSPQQLAAACPSVPLMENGAQATDPSTGALIFQQNVTINPSDLGGTDPLWATMGLTELGPITPAAGTVTPASILGDYTGGHYVVQFRAVGARHGSVLDPSTNPYVTGEMQCEADLFLASGGSHLDPGCSIAPPN